MKNAYFALYEMARLLQEQRPNFQNQTELMTNCECGEHGLSSDVQKHGLDAANGVESRGQSWRINARRQEDGPEVSKSALVGIRIKGLVPRNARPDE